MVGEDIAAEGLAGDARAARGGENDGGKPAFKVLRALGVVLLTTTMTACANDKNYFSIEGFIVIVGWVIVFLLFANIIRESWGDDGQTPLHSAAMKGQTETVLALIKDGATIDKRDSLGQTPLHNAAWYGKTETALVLVKHGADIDAMDKDGLTPLHLAEEFGRTETAFALRKAMKKRGGK